MDEKDKTLNDLTSKGYPDNLQVMHTIKQLCDFKKEAQKEVLQETRDYLYDNLPIGEINAFDLIKLRKREIDCIDKQMEGFSLK